MSSWGVWINNTHARTDDFDAANPRAGPKGETTERGRSSTSLGLITSESATSRSPSRPPSKPDLEAKAPASPKPLSQQGPPVVQSPAPEVAPRMGLVRVPSEDAADVKHHRPLTCKSVLYMLTFIDSYFLKCRKQIFANFARRKC